MRRVQLKKYVPNGLTVFRMICAVMLLFIRPLSVRFFIVYALAGLSDLLDGYFARRFDAMSERGAKLDSAADFLLCAVMLVVLIPLYRWPIWVIVWIAAVSAVRLSALAVSYIRFRKMAFLHTWLNKATGLLLLLTPVLLRLMGLPVAAAILLGVSTISALEELLIELTADGLNLDRASLLLGYQIRSGKKNINQK